MKYRATVVIIIIALAVISAVLITLIAQRQDIDNNEKYSSLLIEISQGSDEAFREAISLFPEQPAAYLERAIWLLQPNTLDECIDFITRAFAILSVRSHSNDELQQIGSLYSILGTAYFELGKYHDAVLAFKAADGTKSLSTDMSRSYIIALLSTGAINEAERVLHTVFNELTEHDIHLINEQLADAYYNLGELEKAMELYLGLHQERGISFITWQNIGVLHQHFGDFHEARLVFTGMLLAYPDDYRPPMRLSYLAIDEQQLLDNDVRDYSEVLSMYNRSQELNDIDDVDLMRLTGVIAELRQYGWFD
ncbi:MAG: hypothetical protein FWD44_02835 [Oscillospiraceae bacterium]|nr:hypothetical protein [Oscillospiraceae bacterium]